MIANLYQRPNDVDDPQLKITCTAYLANNGPKMTNVNTFIRKKLTVIFTSKQPTKTNMTKGSSDQY